VETANKTLLRLRIWQLGLWKETRGQDLIEYALMAGFVAVAAGAIMPNVASSISTIFSQISSVLTSASTQS
jgi:pilus assembly protein Flp/PilA